MTEVEKEYVTSTVEYKCFFYFDLKIIIIVIWFDGMVWDSREPNGDSFENKISKLTTAITIIRKQFYCQCSCTMHCREDNEPFIDNKILSIRFVIDIFSRY